MSRLIFIHIFTQPNDEQYISLERQSTVEALCELLSLQLFLPTKFFIGRLTNFNAIFLNKMFFADEQSLILSNSAIYQQNPSIFSAFPIKIMG